MRTSAIEVTYLPLPAAEAQAAIDARQIANDAADRATELGRAVKISTEARVAAYTKLADATQAAAEAQTAAYIAANLAYTPQLFVPSARAAIARRALAVATFNYNHALNASAKDGAYSALVSAHSHYVTVQASARILESKGYYITDAHRADALIDQAHATAVSAAEAHLAALQAAAAAHAPYDLAVAAHTAEVRAVANYNAALHDAEILNNRACDAEYAAHTASLAIHRVATEARILKHCKLRPEAEPVYAAIQNLQDYGARLFTRGRSKAGLGAIYFANTIREYFNSLFEKENAHVYLIALNVLLRHGGRDMSDHTSTLSSMLHLTSRQKLLKNIETRFNLFRSKAQHTMGPIHEAKQPELTTVSPQMVAR